MRAPSRTEFFTAFLESVARTIGIDNLAPECSTLSKQLQALILHTYIHESFTFIGSSLGFPDPRYQVWRAVDRFLPDVPQQAMKNLEDEVLQHETDKPEILAKRRLEAFLAARTPAEDTQPHTAYDEFVLKSLNELRPIELSRVPPLRIWAMWHTLGMEITDIQSNLQVGRRETEHAILHVLSAGPLLPVNPLRFARLMSPEGSDESVAFSTSLSQVTGPPGARSEIRDTFINREQQVAIMDSLLAQKRVVTTRPTVTDVTTRLLANRVQLIKESFRLTTSQSAIAAHDPVSQDERDDSKTATSELQRPDAGGKLTTISSLGEEIERDTKRLAKLIRSVDGAFDLLSARKGRKTRDKKAAEANMGADDNFPATQDINTSQNMPETVPVREQNSSKLSTPVEEAAQIIDQTQNSSTRTQSHVADPHLDEELADSAMRSLHTTFGARRVPSSQKVKGLEDVPLHDFTRIYLKMSPKERKRKKAETEAKLKSRRNDVQSLQKRISKLEASIAIDGGPKDKVQADIQKNKRRLESSQAAAKTAKIALKRMLLLDERSHSWGGQATTPVSTSIGSRSRRRPRNLP